MEPFSTSVFKVLVWIFATTTYFPVLRSPQHSPHLSPTSLSSALLSNHLLSHLTYRYHCNYLCLISLIALFNLHLWGTSSLDSLSFLVTPAMYYKHSYLSLPECPCLSSIRLNWPDSTLISTALWCSMEYFYLLTSRHICPFVSTPSARRHSCSCCSLFYTSFTAGVEALITQLMELIVILCSLSCDIQSFFIFVSVIYLSVRWHWKLCNPLSWFSSEHLKWRHVLHFTRTEMYRFDWVIINNTFLFHFVLSELFRFHYKLCFSLWFIILSDNCMFC